MLFQLFKNVDDKPLSLGYYETNATDVIIKDIVADLDTDGLLDLNGIKKAVPTILRARGYICEEKEIKKFGY